MKIHVQGAAAPTELLQRDYLAEGGEGVVYAVGGTAYKIYKDPARALPPGKIGELRSIPHADVIKPLDVILDPKLHTPIGYTMRMVRDTRVLVEHFPRAFRERHGIKPEDSAKLVLALRERMAAVHAAGVLAVDFNEYNTLVGGDNVTPYLIDVDSYQTKSYRATALMESVRDRHSPQGTFTEGTDWFAFACVAFQVFVGIHPYKGRVKSNPKMTWDERFLANLSVLSPGVSVPPPTLPFGVIPQNFRDWFEAVLDRGERIPPPKDLINTIILTAPVVQQSPIIGLLVKELLQAKSKIRHYFSIGQASVALTEGGVCLSGVEVPDSATPNGAVATLSSARFWPFILWAEGGRTKLWSVQDRRFLEFDIEARAVAESGGRLYVLGRETVVEVNLHDSGSGSVVPSPVVVARVHPQASRLFSGCVVQSLLGSTFVHVFPGPKMGPQVRIPELDGLQVIDAKFSGNLLAVLVRNGSQLDRYQFRFDPSYMSYDATQTKDVSGLLDFITIDKGAGQHIALMQDGMGGLTVFSTVKASQGVRAVDSNLPGDARLVVVAGRAGFLSQNKVFSITMQ
jgi:hypothetical protein